MIFAKVIKVVSFSSSFDVIFDGTRYEPAWSFYCTTHCAITRSVDFTGFSARLFRWPWGPISSLFENDSSSGWQPPDWDFSAFCWVSQDDGSCLFLFPFFSLLVGFAPSRLKIRGFLLENIFFSFYNILGSLGVAELLLVLIVFLFFRFSFTFFLFPSLDLRHFAGQCPEFHLWVHIFLKLYLESTKIHLKWLKWSRSICNILDSFLPFLSFLWFFSTIDGVSIFSFFRYSSRCISISFKFVFNFSPLKPTKDNRTFDLRFTGFRLLVAC